MSFIDLFDWNKDNFLTYFLLFLPDFDGVVRRSAVINSTEGERDSTSQGSESGSILVEPIEGEGEDPTAVLIGYFESIDSSEFTSPAEEEALALILERISDDRNSVAEEELIDELSLQSSLNICKAMLSILSGRIPEEKRQGRLGPAVLKRWVQETNEVRTYMFYSKPALIEVAAFSSAGIRLQSTFTFDIMIKKILEARQHRQEEEENASSSPPTLINDEADTSDPTPRTTRDITITQEIIKALLERSFMKLFKGAARDYCSMGHKLELPLAKDWMKDVNEKGLFPGYKIVSLHKVGAVGKKIILGLRIVLIFWHLFLMKKKIVLNYGV